MDEWRASVSMHNHGEDVGESPSQLSLGIALIDSEQDFLFGGKNKNVVMIRGARWFAVKNRNNSLN